MRNVIFDLTSEETVSRYCFAGFEGEHNATLLRVHLPSRMCLEDGEYRFLFETAKGEAVFSAPVSLVDGSVSVLLPRALMVAPRLKAYVGCYQKEGGETRLILKSGEMILGIQKSGVDGDELDLGAGELPGLVLEDSVLPDSENPVKSNVLFTALGEKVGKGDLSQSIPEKENARKDRAVSEKAVVGALELVLKKEEYEADEKVRSASTAPALKGKKSGNPIALPDVSPLPHEIKVKLKPEEGFAGEKIFTDQYEFFSGDGVYVPNNKLYDENDGWCYEFEDGSYLYNAGYDLDKIVVKDGKPYRTLDVNGAVVQRYGLNLFDQETFFRNNGFELQADGSWIGKRVFKPAFTPPVQIKGSMYIRLKGKNISAYNPFYLTVNYVEGGQSTACTLPKSMTKMEDFSFATRADKTVKNIYWNYSGTGGSDGVSGEYYIKDVIFSYADAPYEPYTGEQETLTATDGTLSIVGNGESMTLLAEDGVTMEAEYNRDINKAFAELLEKIGGNV